MTALSIKKITRLLICLIFALWTAGIQAQHQLTGSVLDRDGLALEFVNVLLSNPIDSSIVAGQFTDAKGNYILDNIPSGEYLLELSFIGFVSNTQNIHLTQNTTLQSVILLPDENLLNAVNITTKKPVYERKADRTIVNVQNAISSAGNDALQILERSPGVQLDRANNAISLMGKNGVVVAINGKQSRLEQEALMQLLASTPSSNIKSIELITNPPASYDAQGDGGIINIVMVKNENDGFNGNLNLLGGMSRKAKYGGGINFNLNQGIMNLYGDFSTNNDHSDQGVMIRQKIQYSDQLIDTYQDNIRPNYTGNHAGKIGLDLQIAKGIDYGVFVSASKRDWSLDATSTTEYFTPIQALSKEILSSDESNSTNHYMVSNHLGIQLNENNRITLDYDYLNYEISNPTTYELQSEDVDGKALGQSTFESDKYTPFDFHVIKSDFEGKITEDIDFQIGAKATLSEVSNDTRLTHFDPDPMDHPFFTDIVNMDEQILAGYVSFNGTIGQSNTFRAGVRYEDYQVDLNSAKDGNLINRGRGRFYPTVSFNHKFSDTRSISLSYNERVNRPGFQVLAPAFYFFDVNTVLGGNVQALPTISRTVGGDFNWGTLFFSLTYTDEDDPISWGQPALNDDSNILILKPQNTPDRDIISAAISFPIQVSTFWSTRWNFNLFHRKETAFLEGNVIDNKAFAAFGNLTQNFKLSKQWDAEISTQWNSKFQLALASFKPRISTNLGLQRKFDNGSKLSLSWNDILNLGSFFGVVNDHESEGIFYDFNYEMEGNVIRATFSTPFGNSGLKIRDKHTAGSAEEQQRAQN